MGINELGTNKEVEKLAEKLRDVYDGCPPHMVNPDRPFIAIAEFIFQMNPCDKCLFKSKIESDLKNLQKELIKAKKAVDVLKENIGPLLGGTHFNAE